MVITKIKEREDKLKILIISILLSISIILQLYFQLILRIEIIFSHFYYIPIILACLWWKRNGLVIPAFLATLLIFFPIFIGENIFSLTHIDNIFRAILLIVVGIVLAVLSKHISKTENQLKGRIKELNCLYGIITTINDPNKSVSEILTSTIDKIRCAWQVPKLICAKITFDGKTYQTPNFKHSPWKLSKAISIKEKELAIDIHYIEEQNFLKEEEALLEEILKQLKAIFDLKLTWIK
jgi:K+-sensing histidine kinase KdpD